MGEPRTQPGEQLTCRHLGDFEIVREIGRGGMGVVYEARQVSLNRRVALKVLSGGLGLTPKAVQRFHREAEAAAKLHHTNIVPVYATGEEDGTHFYAMELIDGPSLDHVIRHLRDSASGRREPAGGSSHQGTDVPRSPGLEATGPYVTGGEPSSASGLTSSSLSSDGHYFDTVARMIAEVADALEYAHQQGVIHRDIKPSNLLLSPAGRLSINDFGLARMLEQPGMTMTGEFVGTPAYMSPEQITAGRAPLNHRTDIYSLGATLYELLTLQRPFTGERRDEVIAQIMHKEPKSPRRINRKVPVDLETICLKAMEKDPDRRYQTAGQLAEDLRRYVNRFAISARRVGPVGRLVKWVRRRPAVAASLACVFLAVCVTLVFAYQAHRAEQQRAEEQERHRLKLLEEKIDRAYTLATNSYMREADEVINEIEKLGGPPGQAHLLRGIVYQFSNEYRKAVSELEKAVDLLPESVAARALLVHAYHMNGQYDRKGPVFIEMERLSPATAEDYLFKGLAQEVSKFDGTANVNEELRIRDSAVGRQYRAVIRKELAFDTRNLVWAEDAVKDADTARRMMPDDPKHLFECILSRLCAAVINQETNHPDRHKELMKEAEDLVHKLEPHLEELPDYCWAPVFFFYENTGNWEKVLEVGEHLRKRGAGDPCAMALYHLGRFPKALEYLDDPPRTDPGGQITRLIVLAEQEPDGPLQAFQEFEKLTRNAPRDQLRDWLDVLLFLGRRKEAIELNEKCRGPYPDLGPEWNQFFEAEWKFTRGELSAVEYLPKAGVSYQRQSAAHYRIGLFHLAAGDRRVAREHFELGARWSWGNTVKWCRMFLSRMEKNPNWPEWITMKNDQPKP